MPQSACSRPSTSENSTLEYEAGSVLKENAAVVAAPTSSRVISYLNKGESIKVLERASNAASDGKYYDTIVTNTVDIKDIINAILV